MPETLKAKKERIIQIDDILAGHYPYRPALKYETTFQLLVATILSAQCTDERVNLTTPALFEKFPGAAAFAAADPGDVEELIRSTGFYRQKTKSILGAAIAIVEKHGGEVPLDIDAMVKLPGVGRKTANVVLGNAEGIASGVVVDTHVKRLANRMGFTTQKDPDKIEQDLMKLLPEDRWVEFSNKLIYLGRDKCKARKAQCGECVVAQWCPKVGLRG